MAGVYMNARNRLAIERQLQEYFASVLGDMSSAFNMLLVALILAHAILLVDAPVQLIGTFHDQAFCDAPPIEKLRRCRSR